MLFPSKKTFVFSVISALTLAGILSSKPPEPEEQYTNLKILSNKLTDEEMDGIMHGFNKVLGYTCMNCHVLKKGVPYPEPMDFASDEKPEKRAARGMMAMSIRLNKKYFNEKVNNKIHPRPTIWCGTCHQGSANPNLK